MIDYIPKVFVSYAWTNPEYKKQVISIAEQLRRDGIDVVLDVWDLKKGNDKYKFMEQCVTDPSINKVLIFSNKVYAEKANNRTGGVGDETLIITSEVYGRSQQSKFIPVIMERDENGKEYVPAYLKSLVYADFTNPESFEDEYKSLVRLIYDVPEYRKPELGMLPSWLNAEVSPTTQKLKMIISRTTTMDMNLIDEFQTEFIEQLRPYYKEEYKKITKEDTTEIEILADLDKTKELRDAYLDFVKRVIKIYSNPGDCIGDMLENLYNSVCFIKTFDPKPSGYFSYSIDIFKYICWELFICVVALLLRNESYKDLHDLLCRTYFLRPDFLSESKEAVSYARFFSYSEYLERIVKPRTDNPRLYTLEGNELCIKRVYEPLLSSKVIASADLFLYQVYPGFLLDKLSTGYNWFPTCYVYADRDDSIWKRLVSKRYCRKMYPLFGVDSLDSFKDRIKKCIEMEPSGYTNNPFYSAPTIKSYLDIEQIGVYE